MKCFVHTLFPQYYQHPFLQRVQDFHNETGEPIYLSIKQYSITCPTESKILNTISQHLTPHHISLISGYIPKHVMDTARHTYHRTQYHKIKQQSLFIENAVQQIGEYDPFFLSMDNIHDHDALLTSLLQQKSYHQEQIIFLY